MDDDPDKCEWIALRKAGHVDLDIDKRTTFTHLRQAWLCNFSAKGCLP